MKKIHLLLFFFVPFFCVAQNVGIGTTTPAGKLHIKGSADTSQLTIDANSTQTNKHPLIRLRNAAGADLLQINSDNPENVFIGLNAGSVNDQANGGLANTFIGSGSGSLNTKGGLNTAIGKNAIHSNTFGGNNSAIGYGALSSNTIGSNNTANGFETLFSNTEGNSNVANGSGALFSNIRGSFNTANGMGALSSNIAGQENTANGSNTLFFNTNGSQNTASGAAALFNNTTGYSNTANGYQALSLNSEGSWNVAIGSYALLSNTSGINNSAIGYQALYANTSGYYNNAIGSFALSGNTTGISNSASGLNSLFSNTSGSYNTANGYNSLYYNQTGLFNIAIGANSGTDPGSPNIYNTISIGNNGYLNAANNQAFIGNKSTVWIGGNVTWSTFSDARIKTNIKENVKGLDFIMKLRPVTYFKSIDAITQLTSNKETPDYASKHEADKMVQSGFLAQEVEQAAKSVGYNFSGLHVPANSKQLYSLSYSEFVVPLVKGMQEQQKMIEDLQKLIKNQQAEIEILKQKVN